MKKMKCHFFGVLVIWGGGVGLWACGGGSLPEREGSENGGEVTPVVEPSPDRLRFVQAVDGAFLVSLSLYDEIPIHLEVLDGHVVSDVVVRAGEKSAFGADPEGDGVWTVLWDLEGSTPGEVLLTASALIDGTTEEVHADLRIEEEGVQFTDYSALGVVATPRILRRGDQLFATWTDRRGETAQAWLQRIDGAARPMGELVELVHSENAVLYARSAAGEQSIGVFYQEPGSPIRNYLTVVSFTGEELTPPVLLDPEGTEGVHGGDIAFDGDGFVVTWFSNRADGTTELNWARLSEGLYELEGPVGVASSSTGDIADPVGRFTPGTTVKIATVGGRSAISFVRDNYHPVAGLALARAQVGIVDNDGTLLRTEYLSNELSSFIDWESAVFGFDSRFVAVWAAEDLTSSASTPPVWFYGKISDSRGDFGVGGTSVLVGGSGIRESVVVKAFSDGGGGVMGWLEQGETAFELYCTTISSGLVVASDSVQIEHAVLSSGQAELQIAEVGTNSLISWRDRRNHGAFSYELWFDTLWR